MIDAHTLISRLGGATKLAQDLQIARGSIYNWPRDGVPSKHWPRLVKLSQATVQPVTFDELEQMSASALKQRSSHQGNAA